MQCPVDGTQLVMSDRQGIEIDYCPQCRGVWLDRGEIDKIVERSATQGMGPAMQQPQQQHPQQQYSNNNHGNHHSYDDDDDDYHGGHHQQKHHKRESWFGELFD